MLIDLARRIRDHVPLRQTNDSTESRRNGGEDFLIAASTARRVAESGPESSASRVASTGGAVGTSTTLMRVPGVFSRSRSSSAIPVAGAIALAARGQIHLQLPSSGA